MAINYRRLNASDVTEYYGLRLHAVTTEPRAFLDSPQEVADMPLEQYQQRLQHAVTFGSFDGSKLIGTAGYFIPKEKKYAHRGYVNGVYLLQEYRGMKDSHGQSIAYSMMQQLLHHAQAHVEHLELSYESQSHAAGKLYARLGFKEYGRFPCIMKLEDGTYVDDIYMWMDLTK